MNAKNVNSNNMNSNFVNSNNMNAKNVNSNFVNSKIVKEILYTNQIFDGLINYLKKQSSIQNEVEISCSSLQSGDLRVLLYYENRGSF